MSNGHDIRIGDVCLDLAQGRPVHVIERYEGDAAEWSEANDYDLCGNYANDRLAAASDDAVYECVYCSNAKSEPSKTYAFPESRLLRIETEAADARGQVYDRVARDLLERLFISAFERGESIEAQWVADRMETLGVGERVVSEAWEIADATVGTSLAPDRDTAEGTSESDETDA